MESILCKLHIVLVVIGASVILFEPLEGALDCNLLSAILSNTKYLSKMFCFKAKQEKSSTTKELTDDDPKRKIPIRDSKTTELIEDSSVELSNQSMKENSLVDQKEDFSSIESVYDDLPDISLKFDEIRGNFSHIRDVAGDGNCFFRAYAFAYFEYLLNHSQEIANFQTLVRKVKDELFNWFDKNTVEKMHKMFEKVIKVTESGNSESLYKIFNQPSYSNNVVQYLRWITSAEMRKNKELYSNYLTDDKTFEEYCTEEVETMGKDSDNIHIMALSYALKINVEVVSIDESPSTKPRINKFPDENLPCCIHLLFIPGHYGILYRIKDETCN